MKQYQDLLQNILDNGIERDDRTGVGTRSVFGRMLEFDLKEGFPIVTVKKVSWIPVVAELLWFLEGSSDERRLAELTHRKYREDISGKRTIWTANADGQGVQLGFENNDNVKILGRVYGVQWRSFGDERPNGVDQIENVLYQLTHHPHSRRILVSAWDAYDVFNKELALPPCHVMFQFYVDDSNIDELPKLSCHMYQRSVDCALGLPFNISSYALLTHIIAREVGMKADRLIMSLGDCHIYNNHLEGVNTMISRDPLPLPTLRIEPEFDLKERLKNRMFIREANNFKLINYNHHETIRFEMAV